MARVKKVPEIRQEEAKPDDNGLRKPLCWETFFMCQRSPVLRSQMLTTLMAGTPIEAERVPVAALLDVVLIAMAARQYCAAEIADDYRALLSRTEELWARPDWTTRVFSSLHAGTANFILKGSTEFTCAEDLYIPSMVAWYMRYDPPSYFTKELTEKDFPALFTARKSDAAFAARLTKSSGKGPASIIKALKPLTKEELVRLKAIARAAALPAKAAPIQVKIQKRVKELKVIAAQKVKPLSRKNVRNSPDKKGRRRAK